MSPNHSGLCFSAEVLHQRPFLFNLHLFLIRFLLKKTTKWVHQRESKILIFLSLRFYFSWSSSNQYDTQVLRKKLAATNSPIVNVVVEVTVTHSELKLLQTLAILHHVQSVVNIITNVSRRDKHILNTLLQTVGCADVVVAVSNSQQIVSIVLKDTGG